MPVPAREDISKAEQLEQQGDAALDADSATAFYCQAQRLLIPAGVVWSDRAEYDERMLAYNRVQEKRYGISGRAYPVPRAMSEEVPVGEPENAMPAALEAWRILAGQRQYEQAANLLRPKLTGRGGMGDYVSQGYGAEQFGDSVLESDVAWARRSYESALESYLLYSLLPARGDSEERGYELAEGVLSKLEKLPAV